MKHGYTVYEELNNLCDEVKKAIAGQLHAQFPHLWALELPNRPAHPAVHPQDSAMLQRDEPKPAAHAPAAEDPLVKAVSDAIEALREEQFECALDEVQNHGRHDPNYARADAAEADLLKAIDDLIADRIAALAKPAIEPAQTDPSIGLLVEHRPGARVKGGEL